MCVFGFLEPGDGIAPEEEWRGLNLDVPQLRWTHLLQMGRWQSHGWADDCPPANRNRPLEAFVLALKIFMETLIQGVGCFYRSGRPCGSRISWSSWVFSGTSRTRSGSEKSPLRGTSVWMRYRRHRIHFCNRNFQKAHSLHYSAFCISFESFLAVGSMVVNLSWGSRRSRRQVSTTKRSLISARLSGEGGKETDWGSWAWLYSSYSALRASTLRCSLW